MLTMIRHFSGLIDFQHLAIFLNFEISEFFNPFLDPATSAPQSGMAFQAARESKRIRVDEANPEHTVIIGAGLEEK